MITMRGSAGSGWRAGAAATSTTLCATGLRPMNQTTIKLVGMLAATPAMTPMTTAIASADSRWPTIRANVTEKTTPNSNQVRRLFIGLSLSGRLHPGVPY